MNTDFYDDIANQRNHIAALKGRLSDQTIRSILRSADSMLDDAEQIFTLNLQNAESERDRSKWSQLAKTLVGLSSEMTRHIDSLLDEYGPEVPSI